MKLCEDMSLDQSSTWKQIKGAWDPSGIHMRTMYFHGVFNGASAQVEASLDGETLAFIVTDIFAIAQVTMNMQGKFPWLRVTNSGGQVSTSITVEMY